jgi:hypothetical protein
MHDAVRNFLKFSFINIKVKNPTLAEGARMGHPARNDKGQKLNSILGAG